MTHDEWIEAGRRLGIAVLLAVTAYAVLVVALALAR